MFKSEYMIMKIKHFCFFPFLFLIFLSNAQTDFKGVWQGVIVKDGYKNEQGLLFYANFEIEGTTLSGKTRDEIYNTDFFAVKKIKGTISGNELNLSQFAVEKKKNSSKSVWCNVDAKLKYNDSTGYLVGTYKSSDCKGNSGKIILYKSSAVFSAIEGPMLPHAWFSNFISDLKKGYNAPLIRELERKNFAFQTIYFDYDKAEIRPENYDYLKKLIRVVDAHSDLRIKVTGHTDGDGSEEYNLELSRKRAEALIDFFVKNGLSKDRIEIDFKGKSDPVDRNDTPEGKQRNRRVDFSFI